VSLEQSVLVEVVGEGKTDVGRSARAERPVSGVVPILLHTLCGKPQRLLVKRRSTLFLQGKGLWQKVRFAKRQAKYNQATAAVVFVVDSEGNLKASQEALVKGRDYEFPEFPMAIGIAHPCIETWLLADSSAIQRGLGLAVLPQAPQEPESLPAPRRDRRRNPKTILVQLAGRSRRELSAEEKDRIATAIADTTSLCIRCPLGFAPFAAEIDKWIRPLF